MKDLRDYQIKSQMVLARDSSGLDGSDLGTGKTLTGVERVREIADGLGHVPRVLVVAPVNTHRQWLRLFAEQFPSLDGSPLLRLVGTPNSDPESWNGYLRKKRPGICIIGWEAMRGMCPISIQIITQEAFERRERLRGAAREARKVLKRKRSSDQEKLTAQAQIAEFEEMQIPEKERAVTLGEVPEGWVPDNPGGASRGYGKLYKGGRTLTKAAVKAAVQHGDVPPWTRTGTWDLVIADESHRMARKSSINKITMTLLSTRHKLAMSATPAGNKPEGLWSTLNWLWPKQYSAFWRWASTFMEMEDSYVGRESTVQKIVGEKDPGSTWLDIPCKVRHRVEDVRDQLPDVIERIVEIPMASEQQRIYDEFADRSLAWIDDHPVGERLPLSQRIRLRQAALGTLAVTEEDPDIELGFRPGAAQPKLDMVKDILSDLPDNEPVIVYTHSAKWARMAVEALNSAGTYGEARAWTGDLSQKKRDAVKDLFGVMTPNGPRARFSYKGIRIIVAQLQAIAEGVDGLQHRCACEIWASPTEAEATVNGQARGRLHRDGQTRPVQRWLLHSLDTIDVGLDASLRLRREQMKQFYRDKAA